MGDGMHGNGLGPEEGGLLGAVLATHHRELEELLAEARRQTPTTGVAAEMAWLLQRRTLIHLAGVERAVWPRLAEVDPDTHRRLVDNHDQLRDEVGRLRDAAGPDRPSHVGRRLPDLLADHEWLEESAVVPYLEHHLGWRGLWVVGHELTAAVDAEPTWAPRS